MYKKEVEKVGVLYVEIFVYFGMLKIIFNKKIMWNFEFDLILVGVIGFLVIE